MLEELRSFGFDIPDPAQKEHVEGLDVRPQAAPGSIVVRNSLQIIVQQESYFNGDSCTVNDGTHERASVSITPPQPIQDIYLAIITNYDIYGGLGVCTGYHSATHVNDYTKEKWPDRPDRPWAGTGLLRMTAEAITWDHPIFDLRFGLVPSMTILADGKIQFRMRWDAMYFNHTGYDLTINQHWPIVFE